MRQVTVRRIISQVDEMIVTVPDDATNEDIFDEVERQESDNHEWTECWDNMDHEIVKDEKED